MYGRTSTDNIMKETKFCIPETISFILFIIMLFQMEWLLGTEVLF